MRYLLGTFGDPESIKPVGSDFNRTTKNGDIHMVDILHGSHFNYKVGNLFANVNNLGANSYAQENGRWKMTCKKVDIENGTTKSSFDCNTVLQENTNILLHMQLSDIPTGTHKTVKTAYVFNELVTNNKLKIQLIYDTDSRFKIQLLTEIEGVEKVYYSKDISHTTISSKQSSYIDVELKYLNGGRSKFYITTRTNNIPNKIKREWIGDIEYNFGESNVYYESYNEFTTNIISESDYFFIFYNKLDLVYDLKNIAYYNGSVKIYDTLDSSNMEEQLFQRVYDKKHIFMGNMVLENSMVRYVFSQDQKGKIDCYVWNYLDSNPKWVKGPTIYIINNLGQETKFQNFKINTIRINQVGLSFTSGKATYYLRLSKGSSSVHIRIINSIHFQVETELTSFKADTNNTYALDGIPHNQSKSIRVNGILKKDTIIYKKGIDEIYDNYLSFFDAYTTLIDSYLSTITPKQNIGFISSLSKPDEINLTRIDGNPVGSNPYLRTLISYKQTFTNNQYSLGFLITDRTGRTGDKENFLTENTKDDSVKFRANCGLLSFDQQEVNNG